MVRALLVAMMGVASILPTVIAGNDKKFTHEDGLFGASKVVGGGVGLAGGVSLSLHGVFGSSALAALGGTAASTGVGVVVAGPVIMLLMQCPQFHLCSGTTPMNPTTLPADATTPPKEGDGSENGGARSADEVAAKEERRPLLKRRDTKSDDNSDDHDDGDVVFHDD